MLKKMVKSAAESPTTALRKLVDSPIEVLKILRGEVNIPQKNSPELVRLFSDTDIDADDVEKYLEELERNPHIHQAHQKMADIHGAGELQVPPRCIGLYILVRHHQPSTVVETGSYFGHSTTYILSALMENKSGNLHSFDAHPNKVGWFPDLPQDFELGYMIPEELRERWTLHNGDVTKTLEEGLEELGKIDLFFHDSNHKESHKRFEFELAQQYLTSGGVLASHDVGHGNESDGSPASYAFVGIAEEMDAKVHSSRDFEPGDDGPRVFAFCYMKSQ